MGGELPKALIPLLNRPLLAWTLEAVLSSYAFSEILVAIPAGANDTFERATGESSGAEIPIRLIDGGETRQASVSNCLAKVSEGIDLVAIHDAARPLLTGQIMLDTLNQARETGAAIAAVPVKDTVKLCEKDGIVSETLDRSRVWLVQTPQCFRYDVIASAHERACTLGYRATDDAALVERIGAVVHIAMGSYENIKITTPEDIHVCEEILKRRRAR